MFKRFLVLLCFLLLACQAFADVYLVEPVDRAVLPADSGVISFGKVAGGETLDVVVKKKSGTGPEWDSLSVDNSLLPQGWSSESIETDKTLIARVSIPANAATSTQRLKFTASNSSGLAFGESFYATVSVNENLLEASFESLSLGSVVGTPAKFSLVLNNDSIASHSIVVRSSLPEYWFSARAIELAPLETRAVELDVTPYYYGEKNFSFSVDSALNGKTFSFPARLSVKPTLTGMYGAGMAGFPFFSPAMLPYYLISGFLSLFN